MNKEEKQEIKELINLLYNNHISQYGKRKLENYIKELQKENEKLKNFNSYLSNSDIDYLEGENIKLQKEKEDLEFKLLAKERGIEEANVLIEQLQEENEKLKNDNQVLRETLWEEDKLGGNVSE